MAATFLNVGSIGNWFKSEIGYNYQQIVSESGKYRQRNGHQKRLPIWWEPF
ncbi:hypothetical protein [Emticicia sp. C21]|uniref:hypothetical protein n=1 Tax=Emticicia sp. C21 TaxID=2302915 RepID=UPI00131440ED|nr:hypothetical protein [Emticicia sp. C21]